MDQSSAEPVDQQTSGEGLSYAEMMGLDPEGGDPSARPGQQPVENPHAGAGEANTPPDPADPPAPPPPPQQAKPSERDPDRPVSTHELLGGGQSRTSPRQAAHGTGAIEVHGRVQQMFQAVGPSAEQAQKLELVRNRASQLAQEILNQTPQCADQTAALRKVREAMHAASEAIVRTL